MEYITSTHTNKSRTHCHNDAFSCSVFSLSSAVYHRLNHGAKSSLCHTWQFEHTRFKMSLKQWSDLLIVKRFYHGTQHAVEHCQTSLKCFLQFQAFNGWAQNILLSACKNIGNIYPYYKFARIHGIYHQVSVFILQWPIKLYNGPVFKMHFYTFTRGRKYNSFSRRILRFTTEIMKHYITCFVTFFDRGFSCVPCCSISTSLYSIVCVCLNKHVWPRHVCLLPDITSS